jgi:hypothetical protein
MELGIFNESLSTRYLDIPISSFFCCIFIWFGLIFFCKFELTIMLCLSVVCIHILEFELWRKRIVCELISLWVCLSKFGLVSEFCLFFVHGGAWIYECYVICLCMSLLCVCFFSVLAPNSWHSTSFTKESPNVKPMNGQWTRPIMWRGWEILVKLSK